MHKLVELIDMDNARMDLIKIGIDQSGRSHDLDLRINVNCKISFLNDIGMIV